MRTTGPGQATLLLLDAIAILNRRDASYAVVGAMAAAFHGVIRASQDADALISVSSKVLSQLELDFREAGFDVELKRGEPDDPVTGVLVLEDQHHNRVDLLLGIRGMEAEALSRSLETTFRNEKIRIIGAEDFVAMKLFAGGPKDLEDARGVWEVSGDKLDKALLRKLTRNYGRDEEKALEKLLSHE